MDETYYEVVAFEGGDEIDETETLDTFDEIGDALSSMAQLRNDYSTLSLEKVVRVGDEAEHFEIAYSTAEDPAARGTKILRVIDPSAMPDGWKPGQAGLPKFKPLWDPASMPGRNELMQTIERLPHYKDTSWHNDVSPSRVFAIGDTPYKIFIAPGRITARSPDEQPEQYALFPIEREQGESLDEAFDREEISWDNPLVATDDPMEVMAFIRDHAHADDSAERFRLLDLGPTARSYRPGEDEPDDTKARFALIGHDLAEDDLEINPRGRRARKNPSELEAAKEKFVEFHRHEPRKFFKGPDSIPAKVRKLGKAKAVLYRSDKNDPDTGKPVRNPINYIHDHDAGVNCYTPSKSKDATIDVPAYIRECKELVVLGKCLGFDYEKDGEIKEAKGIKPLPDLCATPCGRALLVVQDHHDVLAIIWGGGLGVESRGIVG